MVSRNPTRFHGRGSSKSVDSNLDYGQVPTAEHC